MTEHLGTKEEVEELCQEMLKQLDLHKNEKVSLRNWTYVNVHNLVKREVRDRFNIIRMTEDKEEKAKQCVHICNFIMMLRLKMLEDGWKEKHYKIAEESNEKFKTHTEDQEADI